MIENKDIVTEAREYYKDKIAPSYFWDMIYTIESQDREIARLNELLASRNKNPINDKNKGLTPEKKEQLKELMGSCPSPISWSLVNMEERYKMSIRPLIELITCESGDFEVLQVNLGEDFYREGHRISNQDWIKLLKELGYPVTKKCLSDENMEYGDYNVKGIGE